MNKQVIKLVLLDLDGTLVNTAPDLVGTVFDMLKDANLQDKLNSISKDVIALKASQGTEALLSEAFSLQNDDPNFHALRKDYLSRYESRMTKSSHLYSGMTEVLQHIEAQHLKWGVVTNKPEYLARPMLEHFNLLDRMDCFIGAEAGIAAKPAPDGLLAACKTADCLPENTLYIGDAKIDIDAAKAACITSVVAGYGYIPHDQDPKSWGADFHVDDPSEIIDILNTLTI